MNSTARANFLAVGIAVTDPNLVTAIIRFMTVVRYLLCLLGIVFAIPFLLLILLAFKLPITISGMFYLIASFPLVSGLVAAPFLHKHFLKLIFTGIIGLFLSFGIRLALMGQNQSPEIRMVTLPEGKESRWLGSTIDEQDSLIFGEELFHLIGGDSTHEHETLMPAFVMAYSEIRSQGVFPSPIVDTYLNLQQPSAFDAVIIEPKGQPTFGVVFLHGYMGNVTAQCWEVAQAVKEKGGVTVCPSTEWTGEWWQPNGLKILNSTFAYFRQHGISKLYLGRLSYGGISIGYLAPELSKQHGISGLFLIDGFTNGSGILSLGLPVLMIEGTQDERIPPPVAHQFASEVEALGTYVEVDSDHFLIMKKPKQVQGAISTWLKDQIDK